MSFKQEITKVIDDLNDIGWGGGFDQTSVEKAIAVLKTARDLGPDLVGLSEDDYEGILLKAMDDA